MQKEDKILERLRNIEYSIKAQKNVLTFKEAAQFIGLSQSYLYKLTSKGIIPHYKPSGKMIYFNREELEMWLLQNRKKTLDEIETYTATRSILNK